LAQQSMLPGSARMPEPPAQATKPAALSPPTLSRSETPLPGPQERSQHRRVGDLQSGSDAQAFPEQVKARTPAKLSPAENSNQQQQTPGKHLEQQSAQEEPKRDRMGSIARGNRNFKSVAMIQQPQAPPVDAANKPSEIAFLRSPSWQDEQRKDASLGPLRNVDATIARVSITPLPKEAAPPRASVARHNAPATNGVHIGKVDIHLQPPPLPQPAVHAVAPPTRGPLALGFVSSFGLRQG
jgi:hypothetical protein